MFAAIGLVEIAIAAILGIVMLFALAAEKEGFATLVALVAVGLLTWLLWDPVKEFVGQPGAAMIALKWAGIYFAVGLVFSIFKWVFYSRKKAKEFNAEYFEWKANNKSEIKRRQTNLNEITARRSDVEALIIKVKDEAEPNQGTLRSLQNQLKSINDDVDRAERNLNEAFEDKFAKYSKTLGAIKVTEETRGVFTTSIDMEKLSARVAAWTTYWPFYAVLLILDDFLRAVFDALTNFLKRLFQEITSWAFNV
jgi:uncharacterized protein YlxW (UPF0749 family)